MTTIAIIQARLDSTRLPRKVLADIAGRSLIARVIDRVVCVREIDVVAVATTTEVSDDELVRSLKSDGRCRVFRGSRDDVLERFYVCARECRADVIVRITADDPLKDPDVNARAIGILVADPRLDYCSNTLQPTFPEGLDVEVFRFAALERAQREAQLLSEREHVTPYIWKHPKIFNVKNFTHDRDLSSWRWTVDNPADLEFARAVYEHFADEPLVPFPKVLAWLERNPHVAQINSGTARNEGYRRSVERESLK